ncbi:MAG TPA: hypothetical protein VFM53_08240 [Anaeromyxobacteraceae bacterium]|nr:hypothetical protein [Anaeromyxobacteraceae bacterium]
MKPVAIRGRNAARCLRAAAELELRSGALYARLAGRKGVPGWLADLLLGMAREEEQHAMRIRLLERLVQADAWPEHAVVRIDEDLREAGSVLARLEAELEAPGPISLPAVLHALVAVERTFDALHAEMLASTVSPPVAELFETLRAQDAQHRELVRDARERRPG